MSRPVTGPQRAIEAINGCARLEPKLRHVLLAMVQWMGWDDGCLRPSLQSLGTALGASRSTVIRRLAELERVGAISFVRRGQGYKQTHVIRIELDWLEQQQTLFGSVATADTGVCIGVTALTPYSQHKGVTPAQQRCQTRSTKVSKQDYKGVRALAPEHPEQSEHPQQHQAKPHPADAGGIREHESGGGGGSNLSPDEIDAIVEAIEHLGVCTATAFELSHLEGMSMTKVRYVADRLNTACATGRIVYPAKLAEKFLRTGEEHLDGYKAWVREDNRRLAARARAQTPTQDSPAPTSPAVAEAFRALLVRRAERFAGSHADHAAFGAFCRSASRAIESNRTLATGAVITTEIEQLQSPHLELRVLSLMAAAAGVSLEVPTDTLRIDRGEQTQGPQNVAL